MDVTNKSDVKRVEDVTLTTSQVPGAVAVSDVTMAENITAYMPQDMEEEDASEIVKAIIADVTTAAVSAMTHVTGAAISAAATNVTAAAVSAATTNVTGAAISAAIDVTAAGSMDTDDRPSTSVTTDVIKAADPKACTDDAATVTDVAAVATTDVDVRAFMDTEEPVTAEKDITESVTGSKSITDQATSGKDVKVLVTEDIKIIQPVTADKKITEPVTADKDIEAPATAGMITPPDTANKDITEPVTADKDIEAPATVGMITPPDTANKGITEPVTADKDITEPVTADKDITEPVTENKDITEPVTAGKDIVAPVTTDTDIAASITMDKNITSPIPADKDIIEPTTTDKDIPVPVTADKDITETVTTNKDITYPVATDKDITTNDTSLDCSNISLPSFMESKSSTGDKFTGNTPECSFEKPQSLSAISSTENSKEVPVVHVMPAEQKALSSVDEKQRTPTELNMQRPFRNIGVSENSSFSSDVGRYLEGGMQAVSSHRSTPSELPSSSSSKDLILMSLAKDAMSTPDDSLQEFRNVDNIEIVQLIEDTTSVSMSMDVDRDASLAEEKEHFEAVPVESAAVDTTPSPADGSLMSKDSIDKPGLNEGEEQTPKKTQTEGIPEESCKSEASGKEASVDLEGDVDMVEEKQHEASGDGGKPGTDADASEKGDDAEKKDAKSKSAKKRRPGITAETETEDDETEDHTMAASKLIEYQWPQEKGSEWYMLQEQVTEYLDIVSFKRKYPDLHRRPVEVKEKLYLLESNIAVSEMQCDLGLTALKSDQVHELMARDYPDKFKEYAVVLQARERQKITDHHKGYELPTIDKTKLTMYMKKAVKSAAEYNSMFMKEKREERRAYFDLQTNEVHYPRQQKLVLPKEVTQVGSYPVALIPGQFQDYYKKYTSQELKYFPMNTALYNPPRPLKSLYPDPNQPSEEETEEEKEETKSGSSGKGENDSSSSSSSSDGSSDSSDSDKGGTTSGDSDLPLKAPTPKSTRKPRTKASKPAWEVTSPSLARLSPGKEQPDVPCNICKGGPDKNRAGKAEDLVKCSECNRYAHPSCLDLAVEMVPVIKTYPWQCMECKTCVKCMEPFDEDQMMFCDHCDRGYHTYCVGVRGIPMGRWECPSCHQEEPPKPKRVRRR